MRMQKQKSLLIQARVKSMTRKLITVVCALLCSCIIFTGCSGYKHIEPSENDLQVVGQVGDKDVYLEELRFVAYTYRDMMTARYGEDIFDGDDADTYFEMLRELVYSNITYGYAVLLLCEEAKISLGEEAILKKVDETLSDMTEELGSFSKYKKYLAENHLTDHFLRYTTEISLLENELMYVYTDDLNLIENDDEALYDIIKNEFIAVRHIFIPHTEENAEEKISEAAAKYANGSNFEELMDEYNRDTEMTSEGLYILDGYMTDEYEEAAFSLNIGGTSDIVSDYNGYYIIERLETSAQTIMLKFDYFKKLYQTYTFYSVIDAAQMELVFTPNDAGKEYMANPFKA